MLKASEKHKRVGGAWVRDSDFVPGEPRRLSRLDRKMAVFVTADGQSRHIPFERLEVCTSGFSMLGVLSKTTYICV